MARTWKVLGPNSSTSKPKCCNTGSWLSSSWLDCGGSVTTSGVQQCLCWNIFHLMLCHQFLEQNPLMRGMLVHEVEAIGTFRYEIRCTDLSDQTQEWDGRLKAGD